jgi:Zn-dependent protease
MPCSFAARATIGAAPVPVPPLDGSKILYTLFGIKEQTMLFLEQYGLFIMIFVVLFFQKPISIFIGTVLQAFLGLAMV